VAVIATQFSVFVPARWPFSLSIAASRQRFASPTKGAQFGGGRSLAASLPRKMGAINSWLTSGGSSWSMAAKLRGATPRRGRERLMLQRAPFQLDRVFWQASARAIAASRIIRRSVSNQALGFAGVGIR